MRIRACTIAGAGNACRAVPDATDSSSTLAVTCDAGAARLNRPRRRA